MVSAGNPFATVLVTARCRNYIDADVGRGVVPVLPGADVAVYRKADMDAGVSAGVFTRRGIARRRRVVRILVQTSRCTQSGVAPVLLLVFVYLGERKDPQFEDIKQVRQRPNFFCRHSWRPVWSTSFANLIATYGDRRLRQDVPGSAHLTESVAVGEAHLSAASDWNICTRVSTHRSFGRRKRRQYRRKPALQLGPQVKVRADAGLR